jgi:hypothetical protein
LTEEEVRIGEVTSIKATFSREVSREGGAGSEEPKEKGG